MISIQDTATTHPPRWPSQTRGAVSITFDNLGEAAEEELGLPIPAGPHPSVTEALPIVLEELAGAGVKATFFVEGVNAESYPDALRLIAAAGHDVAYHGWHHENWGDLTEASEQENLSRGLTAMRRIGVEPSGFRPPGGRLGVTTLSLLRQHGLRHCSPAGAGVGFDEVAILPFSWPAVDAYHLLEQFAPLRAQLDGSPVPGGPEGVVDTMIAAVNAAIEAGEHATLVLHTALIQTEREAVRALLDQVRSGSRRGELWVATCDEVGSWVAEHPDVFSGPVQLDTTSWMERS